ncbi:hypothetical protein GCM10009547_26250 [Sporichthya brevicatena]|uniref:Uncharacterized protein n=1 Tax=Sporichthya brevicatena TaxID=171442 RepID=A0ABN1GXG8_9ACTN
MRVRRRVAVVVGTVTALGVVGAGFAYAATSATTQVKACAKKSDGTLRLANKCKSTEKSVKWAKTGPQGPAGPRGATGPAGPSEVRVFNVPSNGAPVASTPSATFTLPAGVWMLRSDVRIGATGVDKSVYCLFSINASNKGQTFATFISALPGGATSVSTVLPVSATVNLSQSTPLNLACGREGAATILVSQITATRVGSVTPALPPQTFATP